MCETKTYKEVLGILACGYDPVWFAYAEELENDEDSQGLQVDFCCHFRLYDGKVGPFVECACTPEQAVQFAEKARRHLNDMVTKMFDRVIKDTEEV